jgi:hypothetical protein
MEATNVLVAAQGETGTPTSSAASGNSPQKLLAPTGEDQDDFERIKTFEGYIDQKKFPDF